MIWVHIKVQVNLCVSVCKHSNYSIICNSYIYYIFYNFILIILYHLVSFHSQLDVPEFGHTCRCRMDSELRLVEKLKELSQLEPGLGYRAYHAKLKEHPDFASIGLKKVDHGLLGPR